MSTLRRKFGMEIDGRIPTLLSEIKQKWLTVLKKKEKRRRRKRLTVLSQKYCSTVILHLLTLNQLG